MNNKIKLILDDKESRPVFNIRPDKYTNIRCLFDTGANISVWCSTQELLKCYFPDAIKTKFKTFISGYGQGHTEAEIWKIPCITLKDFGSNKSIRIKNFLIALTPKSTFGFMMIFSATMLLKANYAIINTKKIDGCSYMMIESEREMYGVPKMLKSEKYKNIIDSVSVFVQS